MIIKNHHSTSGSEPENGMRSKPTTLKSIGELLGISATTVSRSLIDHPSISVITRLRVKELALKMDYKPSRKALAFRNGRSFTIGIIVPNLGEYFFSKTVTAIQDVAFENDYMVFVGQSHDCEGKEVQLVERMKKLGVDGLLIALSKNTSGFGHFTEAMGCGIPIVFFDRIPPLFNIHSVCCNIETVTSDVVKFLAKRGHHRIGMINGPENMLSSLERRKGFLKAIDELGLSFNSSLYTECDLSEEGAEKCITKLMDMSRGPSAVIAFNDYVALYAIRKMRSTNRCAKTIDFVSFSNLPLLAHVDHAPIATIEQFPEEQGKIATQMLIDLIDGKTGTAGQKKEYKNIVIPAMLMLNENL